jgi:hypothetical protein
MARPATAHPRLVKRIVVVTIVCLAPVLVATPAGAAPPRPKAYANCAALNKVYPHGVARAKTVVDKTTSRYKVRNFFVDPKTYALNDGRVPPLQYDLDRDNDGIACEKR